MYQYCYKKVQSHMDGWGPFNGNLYSLENYREIIDEMARQGWRYVGFVPSHIAANGQIAQIDLVFERAAQG